MKPREAGEMQSRYDIGFGKSRSGGWSQKVPKGLCTMSLGVVRSILPPPPTSYSFVIFVTSPPGERDKLSFF